jgi:hypothetical protein
MNARKAAKPLHHRSIEHRSWLHEDGALEIEGRLIDSRAYDSRVGFDRPLPAGEALHDMTIRILLGPDWRIRDIGLAMESSPFDLCSEVMSNFETLRGASMGKGWNALLGERFAGVAGCRHLVDLLRGMATVAFQSMPRSGWTREAADGFVNSCHAFREEGPVMLRLAEELAKRNNQMDE